MIEIIALAVLMVGFFMILNARTWNQLIAGVSVCIADCVLLMVAPVHAAEPVHVTVSVTVDDTRLNEPFVRQLVRDASDIVADLGVSFEVVEYETYDPAPGINNPRKVLESQRLYRKHQIGNVYLLITERDLGGYNGYASNGPPCTMAANALSRPVAQTIAHELLHTMGIEHDPELYLYLMSIVGESATISDYTRAQFAAGDYSDCGTRYAEQGQSAQAAPPVTGGGGSWGAWAIIALLLLILLAALRDLKIAWTEIMRLRADVRDWKHQHDLAMDTAKEVSLNWLRIYEEKCNETRNNGRNGSSEERDRANACWSGGGAGERSHVQAGVLYGIASYPHDGAFGGSGSSGPIECTSVPGDAGRGSSCESDSGGTGSSDGGSGGACGGD